jgi:outer membrane immunogenic protein
MKRMILGVAAALMLSAGPAVADGLPSKGSIKAAPAAAGPNWNGFYVGVGIGAGAVVHDVSVEQKDKYCNWWKCSPWYESSSSIDGIGGEGIFGTVTLGYDRVVRPGWVAGVFADYDFSDISTDISVNGVSGSLDHTYSWAVGARLGFLTNPSTLLYGTAGYAQAEFDFGGGSSPTFDGYFVGAGIETFLRDNWTLRLEYRYTQLSEENIFTDDKGLHRTQIDFEPSMHTARVVLSYKFGHRD